MYTNREHFEKQIFVCCLSRAPLNVLRATSISSFMYKYRTFIYNFFMNFISYSAYVCVCFLPTHNKYFHGHTFAVQLISLAPGKWKKQQTKQEREDDDGQKMKTGKLKPHTHFSRSKVFPYECAVSNTH